MKYTEMFEKFDKNRRAFIYFINPETLILNESVNLENGVYINESLDSIVSLLEENGYTENVDFVLVEAAEDVKMVGMKGNTLEITVKGQKYGHAAKSGIDIKEIARKFEKMLQFSSWKALNWLNKQTEIVSGSKKKQEMDTKGMIKEGHNEMTNYMFFGNLKTMKKAIDNMLALDPEAVDSLLNEHDWASDHISTSKDDVEEVCNWLCNTLGEPLDMNESKLANISDIDHTRKLKFL